MRITGAHDGVAGPVLLECDPTGSGGGFVLVSTEDGRDGLSRWDAETGALLWCSRTALQGVNALAAVRGAGAGTLIAAAGEGGVDCWQASDGEPLAWRSSYRGTVWSVAAAYLPGGRAMLVGAGHDKRVHRWGLDTGARPVPALEGHNAIVTCVAANSLPDGTALIASGGDDGHVIRWDAESGRMLGAPLQSRGFAEITNVALLRSPTDRLLVAAGDTNGTLYRWNALTGEPIGRAIEMGATARMLCTIHLDGKPLVIASGEDEVVRRWNAVTGEQNDPPVTGVAVACAQRADGTVFLATGTNNGDVTVCELGRAWP
ncbi:WD40 repeat domain-containing protein [Actinacidiphila cocklensis]|uniref:WD_REPEATS_REGION domain-containing protein n=1 Tax=Actinacidiphila cocklensis TaxID=887465 RepID=A0A9W4E2G5_9ACTN|nr:WD_REPEATS_REGION domain-containing protein [Actinacidiphila cocklensis]